MPQILLVILIVYAVRKAIGDTRTMWRKSRAAWTAARPSAPRKSAVVMRHDAGYFASQAVHGFPVARHGLAAGWHAGRKAQEEGRAQRAKAKADHLDTRVRLAGEIRGHLARQQEALAQIRAAREAEEGIRETAPQSATASSQDGREARPATAVPGTARPRVLKAGTIEAVDTPDGKKARIDGWGFASNPAVADGHYTSLTPAQIEALGYTVAELHEMAHGKDCACPVSEIGRPAPPPTVPQQSPSTQGEQSMPTTTADVTYDGVLATMAAEKANAETRAAEQQQASRMASVLSDQMQALEVDPASLSAMADHLDAQDAAVKAQQRVQETGEAVELALKRGHQGLAEAHQNAPVDAARREFYAS